MLTLQQIINEAFELVPNEIETTMQVLWLNNVNNEFFNTVKIPEIERFNSVKNQGTYILNQNIREKNIDLVMIGLTKYKDLDEDQMKSTENRYSFNDSTRQLIVEPAPYEDDLPGILRYHQIATTTFTSSNLSARPDAPPEYHHLYIFGLCSYIAKAQDDLGKAQVYENDFINGCNAAAQNYAGVRI